jgi:hypothetical protein
MTHCVCCFLAYPFWEHLRVQYLRRPTGTSPPHQPHAGLSARSGASSSAQAQPIFPKRYAHGWLHVRVPESRCVLRSFTASRPHMTQLIRTWRGFLRVANLGALALTASEQGAHTMRVLAPTTDMSRTPQAPQTNATGGATPALYIRRHVRHSRVPSVLSYTFPSMRGCPRLHADCLATQVRLGHLTRPLRQRLPLLEKPHPQRRVN